MTRHPVAPVPDRLFDDEREQRWRARFTAPWMSRPELGPRCPGPLHVRLQRERHHRGVRLGPGHRPAPEGHRPAQRHALRRADPGRRDDLLVRRHRRRRVRALGAPSRSPAVRPDADPEPVLPGVPDGYPAGLEIGRRRWPRGPRPTTAPRSGCAAATARRARSTRTRRTPGSGRCPRTRRCWRSATPSTATPGTRRCGWCASSRRRAGRREVRRHRPRADPARLRAAAGRSPAAAAARAARPRGAAALGRRRGHRAGAGARPAGRAGRRLLPGRHGAAGRAHPRGPHPAAPVRPGHRTSCASCRRRRAASGRPRRGRTAPWSTPARPRPSRPRSARCTRTAPTGCWSPRPATAAPGSVPVHDVWVDGPGGRVHALVVRSRSDVDRPPAVFSLHGGPHAADEDRFSAMRAAWVDAGFVVVEINYRGSTGYGSAWRDAIEGRPGLTELADVAAVPDHCVAAGLGRPGPVPGRGLVLGRLPGPARRRHPARSLGGGHRRRAGGRLPGRLRRRDGAAARVRPGPVRRVAASRCRQVYRTASPLTYVDRVAGAGARAGRRERPALPDPPDRQLPGRAGRPAGGCTTRWPGSTPATARWWSPRRSRRWRPRSGSRDARCRAGSRGSSARHFRPAIRRRHAPVARRKHGAGNLEASPRRWSPWRSGACTSSWRIGRAGSVSWPPRSGPRAATSCTCTWSANPPTTARSPTSCWSRCRRRSTRPPCCDAVRAVGIPCTLLVPADATELADTATTALALARMVAADPGSAPRRGGQPAARPARRPGRQRPPGTPTRLRIGARQLRLGRAWPFTATEISRAAALLELAAQLECARRPGHPRPSGSCCCATGREVQMRRAEPSDAPLVAALHARCSPASRRARFLSPTPQLPPGELAELLGGESQVPGPPCSR